MVTRASAEAGLPPLEVEAPSRRAVATGRTLLEAYYFQDEREAYLLHGNAARARETEERALERMADTYEVEFPWLETDAAREAGRSFMRALFVQDEIENWPLILEAPNRDTVADLLQSSVDEEYGSGVPTDPRWDVVRSHLRDTCETAGIDATYATKQTQFWRLHGQLEEYWEGIAIDAHTVKLRTMVEDPSPRMAETLGEYFVAGVKAHDGWNHRDVEADVDAVLDLVATYYQKIFDMRAHE